MVIGGKPSVAIAKIRLEAYTSQIDGLIARYRMLAEKRFMSAATAEGDVRSFYLKEAENADSIASALWSLKKELEALKALLETRGPLFENYVEEFLRRINNMKLGYSLPMQVLIMLDDIEMLVASLRSR